jgi:hypothetical protein
MPTPPQSDRAALGRERLAARARRIANLRRRIVAGTLASFALAWGVIAFTGPMGVPAKTTTTASTRTTTTATTAVTAAATPSATASPTATPAPVTTSQS